MVFKCFEKFLLVSDLVGVLMVVEVNDLMGSVLGIL